MKWNMLKKIFFWSYVFCIKSSYWTRCAVHTDILRNTPLKVDKQCNTDKETLFWKPKWCLIVANGIKIMKRKFLLWTVSSQEEVNSWLKWSVFNKWRHSLFFEWKNVARWPRKKINFLLSSDCQQYVTFGILHEVKIFSKDPLYYLNILLLADHQNICKN